MRERLSSLLQPSSPWNSTGDTEWSRCCMLLIVCSSEGGGSLLKNLRLQSYLAWQLTDLPRTPVKTMLPFTWLLLDGGESRRANTSSFAPRFAFLLVSAPRLDVLTAFIAPWAGLFAPAGDFTTETTFVVINHAPWRLHRRHRGIVFICW